MLQTLAQAWIRARQDPDRVLKQRSRSSSYLGHESEQGKIHHEYSTGDLGQAASLNMDQSQARSNPSTQTKIKIRQLARAWIRARPELAGVLKGGLRSRLWLVVGSEQDRGQSGHSEVDRGGLTE